MEVNRNLNDAVKCYRNKLSKGSQFMNDTGLPEAYYQDDIKVRAEVSKKTFQGCTQLV